MATILCLFAALTLFIHPAESAKPSSKFSDLLLSGQRLFDAGDYKQATEKLEEAVQVDRSSSEAYLWLGRAYGRRAEKAFALAAPGFARKTRDSFEESVRLNPRNWDAVDDLFDYYMHAPSFLGGGADKASALLDQTIRLEPSRAGRQAGNMMTLARYFAKHDQWEKSDALFRRASAAAPDNAKVVFGRASILIESKRNLAEARDLLNRYLTLNLAPGDPPRARAEELLRQVSGG